MSKSFLLWAIVNGEPVVPLVWRIVAKLVVVIERMSSKFFSSSALVVKGSLVTSSRLRICEGLTP